MLQIMEKPNNVPARYKPYANGRYDVRPGLRRFGADFGNGEADQHIFQFDQQFETYRAAKQAACKTRPDDSYLTDNFDDDVAQAVSQFIAQRLVAEHPQWFELADHCLHCRLTDESIEIDAGALAPLAMQVHEDLAVVCSKDERNWLAAAHICLPSHWSPAVKIGRNFADIHEPVPGIAPISARQSEHVARMIAATQGLVRFAWGLQGDDAIDGHPSRLRKSLDIDSDAVIIRLERQTMWGLPHVNAALFTIHPYNYICTDADRAPIASAIATMSDESLAYKGLTNVRDALVCQWQN
jgi:hypothetical protein